MTAQLDMFAEPISSTKCYGTIDERFTSFINANPQVYRAFVSLAREYLARTQSKRVGAKMVWERMRWEYAIRTRGESDYKLNNSYTSRLARLASSLEPDLRDAFEQRVLRSAS